MNRHPIIIKGRQSCRRGDGIQSNHTRAGPIIRWAGSRNGHYPALLSSIAHISPIFPAIPSALCSSRACLFPASPHPNPSTMGISPIIPAIPSVTRPSRACISLVSPAHHLRDKPIDKVLIADRHQPLHDRLIHCRAPSRPGGAFTASSTVAAGRASQTADCAENSPQRPSFGQTGRKALFPWHGGLTPVRGIINIRSVSTRQAIPP